MRSRSWPGKLFLLVVGCIVGKPQSFNSVNGETEEMHLASYLSDTTRTFNPGDKIKH